MRKLNIEITKAQLTGYSVEFDNDDGKAVIHVTASLALLTAGGKKITQYSIRTNSWGDDDKFELPINCYEPILNVAKELEAIATRHCRDSQKKLPAPKPKVKVKSKKKK